MTVPALLKAAGFDHISERESDGSWEDCTWDAGLEWYRLTHDRTRPSTHAEAQALRAASGEPATGGSNIGDFRLGVRRRYDVILPSAISGYTALKAALKPGYAALVQGSMQAFGTTHRLSRWQAGFDGGHATLVVNVDGILYWCDPLAPETADVPVVISWDELSRYVNAFGGQHLVAPLWNVSKEDTMYPLTSYLAGHTATIKAGSNVRAEPRIASDLLATTDVDTTRVIIGTVLGDVDPANGSNVWYMWYSAGRYAFTAKDNITEVNPPVSSEDDGFTKATQDAAVAAAVAPLNTRINALMAEVGKLKPLADIGRTVTTLVKQIAG